MAHTLFRAKVHIGYLAAIVAAAKRNRCDLIFISSHGRHGFKPSLLGSQTQKVLAESDIPVTVHR